MGKDSSEIRREIEATRARMGDTVEALGYKADVPSRVKDAVNDRVETVKGTISDVVDSVKDAVGGATGKVGNALGGAKQKATSTLSDTTTRIGDATSGVTSGVGGVTDKLPSGEDVKNVARRGVGIAAENPLGLALGALAVGFLAGLVTPVTEYERETVGPIRDDLIDKAQSVGGDVIEHGKQVLAETAQAALQTAQQSAQTHSDQVLSEVKGDTMNGQNSNGSGDTGQIPGMPSNASQGGGLREETLVSGGTGAQTSADKGKTSSQYGVLLDDTRDTLEPGAPGTASP